MPLFSKPLAVSALLAICIRSAYAQVYTNKGLVGFASTPADTLDAFGDTLGGYGSAIAIAPGSFSRRADGSYSGRLVGAPDRGHNTQGTSVYPSRQQYFDFVLNPYYGDAAGGAIGSLQVTYAGGLQYTDTGSANGLATGLDPTGTRVANGLFPGLPEAGANAAVSIDQEGIAYLADGSFFISDEYGPYVYYMNPAGIIVSAIQPPQAFLPYDANGQLDFTSESDPVTGRVANQGFEGLTVSPDGAKLYALLQSATVQDGGSGDFRGKYTRLLEYDISSPTAPALVGEYVVELPVSNSGQARGQSEIYYLSPTRFLCLARDGDGNGNGDPPTPSNGDIVSNIKEIGFFDISEATNIAGTAYDRADTPVAPGGVLNPDVTQAVFQDFISLIDNDQLAKAGLFNGRPLETAVTGKIESITLTSVLDPASPDDYFIFTVADNDYITANGFQDGQPYADPYAVGTGVDVFNQFFVYRVTLPGASIPTFINKKQITPSARARAKRTPARIEGTY